MSSGESKPDLGRAYLESDLEVRLRLSRVGCLFAITLMPAGSSLDYFVYPALVWPFLQVRLLSVLWAAGILLLLFLPFGRRHVRVLGVAWVLVPAGAIAWMVHASEGAMSPYYAGLNLAMIGVCMIMPWTFTEAVIACSSIIAMYVVACMTTRYEPFQWSVLYNNLYFLLLTAVICVTTCYFTARRRFDDFLLRHELDLRNRELAQSYERLSELDRLKSDFFANISHELRTPLTLTLLPLDDLLRRPSLPDDARALLGVMKEHGLRLLKLINDLLELVRVEQGRTQLELKPLDLSLFLPGTVDAVRHLAARKGLTVALRGSPAPLVVRADAARLEQVLINLLVNAVKFTPSPGVITVAWGNEGEYATVRVEDTGIGISGEQLPYIFDRFRQVDGSSTRKYQGAGIGLALARELVQEHGGSLAAESEVGKGTSLTIRLRLCADPAPVAPAADLSGPEPIADVFRAAAGAAAIAADEAGPQPILGSGSLTVLVAEDEPDLRRLLAATLAEEYRVVQAADGSAALAAVREHRPHLALLDVMMPGMDGLDLCREIKADPASASVKVVMLTARTDETAKLTALERGADDFLIKPFSTLEVKTRIRNLMRTAQLEEDLRSRNAELESTLVRLGETEAQLVQTEKMNALGNLAAGLLHEINNPLNFTLTALQVARECVPDGDADLREMLDDIGGGMGRIRDIVSNLRDFAYPSTAEARHPFPLSAALDSALKLLAHEVDGVAVERRLPEDLRVAASKTQITHVLMNLLGNSAQALKSLSNGRKPEIVVSAQKQDDRLCISVRDNGIGIGPETLPKIFNPFFTTRQVGEGTGLGLSICHTIVRNHGGSLLARSEPGEWTEISFDLPLAI